MKGSIFPPVSPLTVVSLAVPATQVDRRPGTELLSPASQSSSGSFLKIGNYSKYIIVLQSTQFWHPLRTIMRVSLSCLHSVREDSCPLLSLAVMHTLKQEGRRFLLFCPQLEWVRKPDPEKVAEMSY